MIAKWAEPCVFRHMLYFRFVRKLFEFFWKEWKRIINDQILYEALSLTPKCYVSCSGNKMPRACVRQIPAALYLRWRRYEVGVSKRPKLSFNLHIKLCCLGFIELTRVIYASINDIILYVIQFIDSSSLSVNSRNWFLWMKLDEFQVFDSNKLSLNSPCRKTEF